MSVCQKCTKPIPDSDARWMFTPTGAPRIFHLDKCQLCGEWTPEEEKLATEKVQKFIEAQRAAPGGCNCTGKR